MKKIGYYIILVFILGLSQATALAADVSGLMDRIHRFDISCRPLEGGFDKRICGTDHSAAFTELIRLEDKASTLTTVEAEIKNMKIRIGDLELIAETAGPAESNPEYTKIVQAAQAGDAEALATLANIDDPSLIPYIINILETPGLIPSPQLREKLFELELIADERIASGGGGLDAAVLAAALERENHYVDALKRAVIALEGARRPYSPWLPFLYAYGVGMIPFLIGVVGSVKYYGRLEPQVLVISIVAYVFYFCMHGFFQFIAPKM